LARAQRLHAGRDHDFACFGRWDHDGGWIVANDFDAALTGLPKRGYAVAIDRSDDERGALYRIRVDLTLEDNAAAVHSGDAAKRTFNQMPFGSWRLPKAAHGRPCAFIGRQGKIAGQSKAHSGGF
jgi:hypothetical protein